MAQAIKPVKPIPPKSVVRLSKADRKTPTWRKEVGRVFRIGYYSRQDGLECVWLVNDAGEYEQSTDHDFLYKYFDIIQVSEETDLFGSKRPVLPPILKASLARKNRRE